MPCGCAKRREALTQTAKTVLKALKRAWPRRKGKGAKKS